MISHVFGVSAVPSNCEVVAWMNRNAYKNWSNNCR